VRARPSFDEPIDPTDERDLRTADPPSTFGEAIARYGFKAAATLLGKAGRKSAAPERVKRNQNATKNATKHAR
jgi:hypothetical protein